MLQLIKRLGFSKVEVEVYVYLAKAGPKSSKDISEGFNCTPQQLRLVLKSLKDKGVVRISRRKTVLFSALEFEELLDFFVKSNVSKALIIEKTRRDLLTTWQAMLGENYSQNTSN